MGIYIKIDKLIQQNSRARYQVSTEAFGGANFYIEINKQQKTVTFFLNPSFIRPVRILDLTDENELVGTLPNIDSRILSRVIMRSITVMQQDDFPEYLDYAA